LWPYAAQLANASDIYHMVRRKQLLPQGRNQIGTAGDYLHIWRVLSQKFNRFGHGAGAQQLEFGEAQSSPPPLPC